MQAHTDLNPVSKSRLLKLCCGFLFATTTLAPAAFAEDPMTKEVPGDNYDSSIRRSAFLTFRPRYKEALREKIKNRRAQLFWRLRFDMQSLQTDGNIQSQIAGANVVGNFNYKFLENLTFESNVSVNLESGRSQGIFGDQEPGSGFYPRSALVHFQPFDDVLSLKAGLIQQSFFRESLFVSNLPFLGLSETLNYKSERIDLSLRLQQLIPTSYTISTRVGEKEATPYFYTTGLEGMIRTSRNNFLLGSVTHYRYESLPSVVAFNSFIYGNTVTNTDVNNAQFIYQFEGIMTQLAFEQKLSHSLSAQVQWHTIKNYEAPDDSGEAQVINLIVANDFGRWIVAGKYKNYFIESDAVPAAYNSHTLGHNNRIGHAYEIDLESKDWGVIFKGAYVQADLLNVSPTRIDGLQQDNQQTIYFAVETMYDFI